MVLLPWINIAIFIERVSNVDLGAIDPAAVWISADGDGHCVNFVCVQKVQSPPWIHIMHCCATGSMVHVGVWVSIDGFVRTAI